jgi:hypothetical protein
MMYTTVVFHYPDRFAPPIGCWWYDEAGLISHYLPDHLQAGKNLQEAQLTGIHTEEDWLAFAEAVPDRSSALPTLRSTITSVTAPVDLFGGVIRHWALSY